MAHEINIYKSQNVIISIFRINKNIGYSNIITNNFHFLYIKEEDQYEV